MTLFVTRVTRPPVGSVASHQRIRDFFFTFSVFFPFGVFFFLLAITVFDTRSTLELLLLFYVFH